MMKRPFSLKNKSFLQLWLAYHIVILLIFSIMLVKNGGKIKIDADLFNMLPKPIAEKAVSVAEARLNELTGENLIILATSDDFLAAKTAAETVFHSLNGDFRFKSVSLYTENSYFSEMVEFIQKYRWNLLDDKAIFDLNQNGGAEAFAQNALATAYSAFTVVPLENLESDPFLLSEYTIQNYLAYLQNSSSSMSLKDGVMAAFANDKWYVMIRAALSKEGSALASKTNGVALVHSVCENLEKDGVRFVYSGTPFHSYKSSTNASREITLISGISMLAVVIVLLLIFKTPRPILCSVGSILISTLTAIMATLGIFGKMHILTLVFGTSLIGSCIDYSLHYFISWKADESLKSGDEIRKKLFKGLTLSLVSTVICYFVLLFAPFSLLKQISVFSLSGTISTFLCAICLYPYLPLPSSNRNIPLVKFFKTPRWYNKKVVGRIVISLMFCLSLIALVVFRKNFKVQNDVSKLYKMEGREAKDEIEAATILHFTPSGYFIASGETPEKTLQNEEKITMKLQETSKGQKRFGYICTSAFIPSIDKQKKSRSACKNLLPLSSSQYEALGFDEGLSKSLETAFFATEDDFIEMEKNVPEYLASSLSSAWIGKIDGTYYSVVLPVSASDSNVCSKIAGEIDGVYYVNKIQSLNADLDKLSKMILTLFLIVFGVIFIVLKFFYTWKQSLKIISVPLLIVLSIFAIFSACNIRLEFFSIAGLVLVFGLGLDYIIYMTENEKRKTDGENARLEPFAIALSFFTTAISFGALALSTFIPVHTIGLSIFIGLVVAYASTFFYGQK
ncbi:MAG: hypothetical protein HDR57_02770 [Treponema sp.]|nr:hypothetical protein [Treponema sp.]